MWTIPNILTMARLGCLPVILALVWPGVESRMTCFWAAVIYGIAGITDLLDGALARKLGQVTVMGKFLDPLSDKLFYLVTMLGLLQLPGPRIPLWVVMIVLIREVSITGLRAIAVGEGIVIAAGEGGKMKTTFATIGMACLLANYQYIVHIGFTTQQINFHTVGLWVTYVSVAFSVSSGVVYVRDFMRTLTAKPAT
ncbi:MAG: CDP-diacylglycerol--glycerol-3-phosphate 3-phosphatidyltransferase [Clostridia bacterium]|nr:CDP-diacylglycerol--glycerol-3-phosphate 3-phosphatidyltransferase [Deltaproteobacteria bacterium]